MGKRVELWEGEKDGMVAFIGKGTVGGAVGGITDILIERPAVHWEHDDRISFLGHKLLSLYGPGMKIEAADNPYEFEGYSPRALTDSLLQIEDAYEGAVADYLAEQHLGR